MVDSRLSASPRLETRFYNERLQTNAGHECARSTNLVLGRTGKGNNFLPFSASRATRDTTI